MNNFWTEFFVGLACSSIFFAIILKLSVSTIELRMLKRITSFRDEIIADSVNNLIAKMAITNVLLAYNGMDMVTEYKNFIQHEESCCCTKCMIIKSGSLRREAEQSFREKFGDDTDATKLDKLRKVLGPSVPSGLPVGPDAEWAEAIRILGDDA